MSRNLAILSFQAGLFLAAAAFQPLRAQVVALNTEDLVQQADVIVEGKVTAMNAEWNADRSRIFTRVTVSVNQQIKGSTSERVVTVSVPGGEIDGIGELYSHTARFAKDEQVVVFAARDSQGQLHVVGGDEGKATVRKEEGTGRKFVLGNESLEMYTTKLKRIVQTQSSQH